MMLDEDSITTSTKENAILNIQIALTVRVPLSKPEVLHIPRLSLVNIKQNVKN
jgi:hypothetical protein